MTAHIKPSVVQNPSQAKGGWDGPVRQYCRDNGLMYQAFRALKANQALVTSATVLEAATAIGLEPEIAFYALLTSLSICPLNGTSRAEQMQQDVHGCIQVKQWSDQATNRVRWLAWTTALKELLDG